MFPFGWGLSYTSFAYSGLHVTRASDGGLTVTARVTNTGHAAGTTVPQVYLGAPSSQQPASSSRRGSYLSSTGSRCGLASPRKSR